MPEPCISATVATTCSARRVRRERRGEEQSEWRGKKESGGRGESGERRMLRVDRRHPRCTPHAVQQDAPTPARDTRGSDRSAACKTPHVRVTKGAVNGSCVDVHNPKP
eukprot:2238660-Rhodomonas_salina.1